MSARIRWFWLSLSLSSMASFGLGYFWGADASLTSTEVALTFMTNEAWELFSGKDYNRAAAQLEKVLIVYTVAGDMFSLAGRRGNRDDEYLNTMMLLRCYRRMGRSTDAIILLDNARKRFPKNLAGVSSESQLEASLDSLESVFEEKGRK